jgi:hypothetical protein
MYYEREKGGLDSNVKRASPPVAFYLKRAKGRARTPVSQSERVSVTGRSESLLSSVRLLVWLYFWLLLWEGALRKWFFPSLSTPLLIVRDPVVLLIYAVALAKRVFPFNRFILLIAALGIMSFGASLIVFDRLGIMAYGLRTNFLHLPLIFVLPNMMRQKDVVRMGRWLLLLSLPMTALVIYQFISPAGAWINAAAGGELGGQLIAVGGHIRPAGIFSFVTGMVSFLSVVAAVLLSGFLDQKQLPRWLCVAGVPALLLSLALSGSRAAVACVTIIVIAALLICARQFQRFSRVLTPALLAYLTFLGFCYLPLFRAGLEVHEGRFKAGGGVQRGIIARYLGAFGESIEIAGQTPLLGRGLGVGTNAGAALMTGSRTFLLGESEWSRVVAESGPILGYAYLMLRVAICFFIARRCWMAVARGQALPFLLIASSGLDLISGQFGQPTILGFAVLFSGLALAAIDDSDPEVTPQAPQKPERRIRGRGTVAQAIVRGGRSQSTEGGFHHRDAEDTGARIQNTEFRIQNPEHRTPNPNGERRTVRRERTFPSFVVQGGKTVKRVPHIRNPNFPAFSYLCVSVVKISLCPHLPSSRANA